MRQRQHQLATLLVLVLAVAPWGRVETQGGQNNPKPAAVVIQISSPVAGQIVFVGTQVRAGEKVAERDREDEGQGQACRRLRVGETVVRGQLLAQLDDREARAELAVRVARHKAAEAERDAAKASEAEATIRQERAERLYKMKVIAEEDYGSAMVTWIRFREEHIAKRAAVDVAAARVRQAEVRVELHRVRSRVRGVVEAILQQKGEGVQAGQPILRLRMAAMDKGDYESTKE